MAEKQHDEKHISDGFYPSNTPTTHTRPLIDRITNDWQNATDDSDSESEYYRRKSAEGVMTSRWQQIATAPVTRLSRIPRRVQRYFVIYATLLAAAYMSWKWFLQPGWESNREIDKSLDESANVFFGSNMRPEFSDMVQIKTLDSRLLPTDENFKQRLVIVGDVHGCKDELQALLDKVKFRAPHDHLILTGDMISKGPDSAGVVSLARSLSASAVRGNHEDRMLLALADMRGHHAALPGPAEDPTTAQDLLDEESFSHGDYAFRSLAREFDDKQIKWLQACPVILRVGEIPGFGEMVVVHAGLVPGIALERQDPYHVMNMRTIDLETRLPSEDRDGTPWEKLWNKYQARIPRQSSERSTVVYGHDSKRGRNINKYSFGLDSGCVVGGKLTALVIEAGRKGEDAKTSIVNVKCKTDWRSKSKSKPKKTET